jgi:hypothetical protein
MKTSAAQARCQQAPESAFKGQLDDAIQEQDTKQTESSDDDTRQPASKNEEHPVPVIVAALTVTLPSPPPSGFGLPSAGLERGSDSAVASNRVGAESCTTEVLAPDISASLPLDAPEPPPEDPKVDGNAEPAFALRLSDTTPDRQLPPKIDVLRLAQLTSTPQVYQQIETARVPLSAGATETPRLAAIASAPEMQSRPDPGVQSAKATTPAPDAAAPAIAGARQEGSASTQSESNGSHDSAPGKQPAAPSPRPERPRGADRTMPEIELKPVRESAETFAPASSAHKEVSLQTAGPFQTAMAPSTIAPRVPAPTSSAAAAPASEHVAAAPAAVRNNPSSEVTEVSLTVPVPRADSTGEDRVAIRMIQRGAEIHVSVRTPDNQLSQALRQDLGKLTTGLDEAGFRTETWRPAVAGVAAPHQSSAHHESSQGAPYRDTPGSDARSGGNEGRNPGEQKRRQPDERPRWVAELEQHENRITGAKQ